ncbi:MAG: SGNH/GDSL hydrolase family protein [Chthoniobacterales bacterium]
MTRGTLTLLAALLCLGSFFLVTNGTARPSVRRDRPAAPPAVTPRILMIGDSLSVGAFGEAVQQHLAVRFRPQNVAAYASCGSSPENWLRDEPGFFTKCGYRESTPDRQPIYRDFVNGHAPRPTLTPKIESLVRRFQPTIVIVQQGTNWMDRNLSDAQITTLLHRFIVAARGPSVRQIVWIEPPDSSAFRRTQGRIHRLIQAAAARDHFQVIDSREMTKYIPGRSGGDGIHYNSESSLAWAAKISRRLDDKLGEQLARNR